MKKNPEHLYVAIDDNGELMDVNTNLKELRDLVNGMGPSYRIELFRKARLVETKKRK